MPNGALSSARAGLLRGFGVCNTIEALGFGLDEEADLRCGSDGTFELRIGSMSNGQGHDTVYAQIAADRLGVSMDRIRVIQGDTDDIAYGTGTGACRSLVVGGAAVAHAADGAIEKAEAVASVLLEAAIEDIRFRDGRFVVAGTDRSVALDRVVTQAGGIAVRERFLPENFTFPNGAHCCEVEVDPETGDARVDRYAMVHDCGTPVNPVLVEAQLRGGVVHGLGQAFSEHVCLRPRERPDTFRLLSRLRPAASGRRARVAILLRTQSGSHFRQSDGREGGRRGGRGDFAGTRGERGSRRVASARRDRYFDADDACAGARRDRTGGRRRSATPPLRALTGRPTRPRDRDCRGPALRLGSRQGRSARRVKTSRTASPGPKGSLARAEFRREEISLRRERLRRRQRVVTLQGPGRLASVLFGPERASQEVRRLRQILKPRASSAQWITRPHEAANLRRSREKFG